MATRRLEKTGLFLIAIILRLTSTTIASTEEQTNHGNDFISEIEISPTQNLLELVPNIKYLIKAEGSDLHTYCFKNVPKSVLQIWRSVQLELINVPNSFLVFPGANESEVSNNYFTKSSWNPSSLIFSGSASVIKFPAFSPYCVGIATTEKYSFHLKVRIINYWKVIQFLLGTFVYFAAPGLSKNAFFHYAAGVSFGVFASILILLYFCSRFVPQKTAAYGVMLFGFSFFCYFFNLIYHHFHHIFSQYLEFVLGYCLLAAFLSFVFCYRIGPVTDERTLNLIQWTMQIISCLLIFLSSEYQEFSAAVVLVLWGVKWVPIHWIKWIKYLWYRCFPPKVKLLTELEYIEQGHIETKKALEELRKYCTSPDCKVWKVVRNLKDPIRFANYIEAGNHYTDEELLEYNSEDFEDYNLDDEDGYVNRSTYVD